MLTFKKRPIIDPTYDTLIYSLSNSNSLTQDNIDDSVIHISESTFTNLNFGKVLSSISMKDNRKFPITLLTTV